MAVLAVALLSSAATAQSLSGIGGSQSRINAVSGDGLTVVGTELVFTFNGYVERAIRWTAADGLVLLGTPSDSDASYANGVSADGSVVVGTFANAPVRWRAGGEMETLVPMPIPGLLGAQANAVSADGHVIVGNTSPQAGGVYGAFRWTAESGMQLLLGISGQSGGARANCISANGLVIAGEGNYPQQTAAQWSNGGAAEALGDYRNAAGPMYSATGINADGSVIVGYAYNASRWTTGTGLIELIPTPSISRALGVSGDGYVVVGYTGSGPFSAMIWNPTRGVVQLATYLESIGINTSGWQLQQATAISADGRTIVGNAVHNGHQEGFVASLPFRFCLADLGTTGGFVGEDGRLDNNDFIAFLSLFFARDPIADRGSAGGVAGADGEFDNNDFIAFINQFFAGC